MARAPIFYTQKTRATMTEAPPQTSFPEEDLVTLKIRIRNEDHLTSNLGYGNAKQRELDVFNNVVWPRLQEIGWGKVRTAT